MRYQIALTLALVLIALLPAARANPIPAQTGVDQLSQITTMVAGTATSHSLDQSANGDLHSDKHDPDDPVPEPSFVIPMLLAMTGLCFLQRRWAIKAR